MPVCCNKTLTLAITSYMYCQRPHISQASLPTEILSNDAKINDLVNLTVTFYTKKANSDFAAKGRFRIIETHLFDMLHIFWQSTVMYFMIRIIKMLYYKANQLHADL